MFSLGTVTGAMLLATVAAVAVKTCGQPYKTNQTGIWEDQFDLDHNFQKVFMKITPFTPPAKQPKSNFTEAGERYKGFQSPMNPQESWTISTIRNRFENVQDNLQRYWLNTEPVQHLSDPSIGYTGCAIYLELEGPAYPVQFPEKVNNWTNNYGCRYIPKACTRDILKSTKEAARNNIGQKSGGDHCRAIAEIPVPKTCSPYKWSKAQWTQPFGQALPSFENGKSGVANGAFPGVDVGNGTGEQGFLLQTQTRKTKWHNFKHPRGVSPLILAVWNSSAHATCEDGYADSRLVCFTHPEDKFPRHYITKPKKGLSKFWISVLVLLALAAVIGLPIAINDWFATRRAYKQARLEQTGTVRRMEI